jgi:hypothetical protein
VTHYAKTVAMCGCGLKERGDMSEIKQEPIRSLDENGDEVCTFNSSHTWSDVLRWVVSDIGKEEAILLLERMVDNE